MKNFQLRIFLLFFLITSHHLHAQLLRIDPMPGAAYADMVFTDANTGFLLAQKDKSYILRTTDGGSTWHTVFTSAPIWHSIHFTSHLNGYVFSLKDSILKTSDGGQTWQTYNVPLPSVNRYYLKDDNNWYATGQGSGSVFYKSENAGHDWIETGPMSPSVLVEPCFVNDTVGFVGGWYSGVIFKTTDAGYSWKGVSFNEGIISLTFPTTGTGYAAGWHSSLFKTTDQGETWVKIAPPFKSHFQSIRCFGVDTCYVAGEDGIVGSTRDGTNWQLIASGTTAMLHQICIANPATVFFRADSFLLTTNMNLSVQSVQRPAFHATAYPNPSTGLFYIKAQSLTGNEKIQVFDAAGRELFSKPATALMEVNLSRHCPGIYFYKISSGGMLLSTGRLVKF